MTNRPTAYLVDQYKKPTTVVLADDMDKISIAGAEFTGLFKREDIAPLQVPLLDQHGKRVGTHHKRPADLLSETAYRDEDDVIWTAPTAFAYAKACEARHKHEMANGDMRMLLAALVDSRPLADPVAFFAAQDAAKAYLNKTNPSKEIAA